MPKQPEKCRPRAILAEFSKLYPHAWKQVDAFREMKGGDIPDWPDWCFLPVSGSYAIVSGGGDNRVPIERSNHIGAIAALATWRVTQGIYRFDEELYRSLVDTPITTLPTAVLYQLPEWCVYIETPDERAMNKALFGFWAHLDWDTETGNELRLVLDTDQGLIPMPLILEGKTLDDSIRMVADHGRAVAERQGMGNLVEVVNQLDTGRTAEELSRLVSLVLYLCSETPDLGGQVARKPREKRTKKGTRIFPAEKPRKWDVGVRLGAALRKGREQAEREDRGPGEGHGERRRPHIRRAHWHSFWKGPKKNPEERKIMLKWLPPIPVNVEDDDELPAVVHKVLH